MISHVLDLQDVEFKAQLADVVVGFVDQRLGELQPIFVDLLWGERRQHSTKIGLEVLLGDLLNVGRVAAQETLDRVLKNSLAT